MKQSSENYQDFFREEIYDGFVRFLLDKLGSATVIALIDDEPVFTKKGVHTQLRRKFNEFLARNPRIERVFAQNDHKTFMIKGISGQPLAFPINTEDEALMVREDIRIPEFIPVDKTGYPKARKMIRNTAEPLRNQLLKGDWKEHKFIAPCKLVVHFKKNYANKIGKTTITFTVISKEEILYLLYDTYRDKVAFAQCGKQKFQFVQRTPKPMRHEQNSELLHTLQQ
jgi:hypothetical protein